ncbi:MAG: hypothetical protein LUG26_01565 [Ruminococcus sp.]|nr:hypothetical protein [Ruminococcus sp.]
MIEASVPTPSTPDTFSIGLILLCCLSVVGIPIAILHLIAYIADKSPKQYDEYLLPKYNRELAEYEEKQTKYESELMEAQPRYDEGMQQILTKAKVRRGDLTADIQSTKEHLQKAYSLNIIPLQFRNIQGIYYLYDYISTSNQGLSEALMQCNLDAIKQKLDNVIRLQGAAIVQQAQANAQLYQQNQQILATAQATMNNTAIAAKYAQISAINSKVSLKLQSKELAYQKADFWLK